MFSGEPSDNRLITIKSVTQSISKRSAFNRAFSFKQNESLSSRNFEVDHDKLFNSDMLPVKIDLKSIATMKIDLNKPSTSEQIDDVSKSSSSKTVTLPSLVSTNVEDFRDAQTIPFFPKWIFGIDIATKMINLSTNKETIVCYSASQLGVIYSDSTKSMKFLQGHQNYVSSMSHDASGKWLVTADATNSNKDNLVIVWNSEDCVPVHTIFDPHPYYGAAKICISQNAKYLVTIGFEANPIFKFWLWTYGREKEDDSIEFKNSFGAVKDIAFNQNKCEHLMVTFEHEVVFIVWENEKLEWYNPEARSRNIKNYGHYVKSTYIDQCHKCVTATTNGWVLIWGTLFYAVPFAEMKIQNNKIHIKAIRLQKNRITTIVYVDGLFATGDVEGHVKFYDWQYQILFWAQNFKLHHIYDIKFNICKRNFVYKNPMEFETTESSLSEQNQEEELETGCRCQVFEDEDEDRSDKYEQIYQQLLPSDFTLDRAPFIVRDFMILTKHGILGFVDFVENKFTLLVDNIESNATCICVHDEKPILCVGCENGKIYIYNYDSCTLVTSVKIVSDPEKEYNGITCIRYSPQGFYLACGTSGGCLWFLDSTVAQPQNETPFYYDKTGIDLIVFSQDNLYLAYSDSSIAVTLLKRYDREDSVIPDWIFHGRFCGHNKPINDLLFTSTGRLFSLSKDSHIVEYDTHRSKPGTLNIITRQSIMQTSLPLCFLVYNYGAYTDDIYFLISSNKYKYSIINNTTYAVEKTILAPILGKAIHKMSFLPSDNRKYIIFAANKSIGIQMLAPTGNPFKHLAIIAHQTKVKDFCISNNGRYVFTLGEEDNNCIMWTICPRAVDIMKYRGGTELTPFYCLINGGVDGWLFQEMKDLFYYMQILYQGEDSPLPRETSRNIAISELPNIMRAIGFYPTEYELDMMLHEAKAYYCEQSEKNPEEIKFENFVKLYINHRPALGITIDILRAAFNKFGFEDEEKISRNVFIEVLCNQGEEFNMCQLEDCLKILLHHKDSELDVESGRNEELLPQEITFTKFINDILGIELPEIKN